MENEMEQEIEIRAEAKANEMLRNAYELGFADGDAGRLKREASSWKREVERRIDEMNWVHDDPTGQDAELLEPLYEELIQARDHELKLTDPERYSEMKAMGLLR